MDTDRNQRFVDLHEDGCLLLPNAWDLGSAKILASAGFPALATTSAGIAFSLGRPDYYFHDGRGEARVDRDTMLGRVRSIVDCVDIPVSADLEDGYGDAPEAVAQTIAMAVGAGAAGGNIEDFTGDRAAPLYELELAVERIRAARAALTEADIPFVLNGRTDAVSVGAGLDEAVRRANAYLRAGADCAFIPGVSWSDQWSFWQEGYPAIMVTDTAPFRYPYYHSSNDTPDKLEYDRFALVVSGMEKVVEKLSNLESGR